MYMCGCVTNVSLCHSGCSLGVRTRLQFSDEVIAALSMYRGTEKFNIFWTNLGL